MECAMFECCWLNCEEVLSLSLSPDSKNKIEEMSNGACHLPVPAFDQLKVQFGNCNYHRFIDFNRSIVMILVFRSRGIVQVIYQVA